MVEIKDFKVLLKNVALVLKRHICTEHRLISDNVHMSSPVKMFSTSSTDNSLRLPRASLQACVRCFLTRDVRAQDAHSLHKSVFPGSPFPGITWTINGNRVLIQKAGESCYEDMPDDIKFYGIRPYQIATMDSPDLSIFDLVFQPDAPHLLFGWNAIEFHDKAVDAMTVLPADWQIMAERVLAAKDHNERQVIIEEFLEPRWLSARRNTHPFIVSGTDWLQSALARAAISRPGTSVRQLERRFKQMVGIPLRQVRPFSRGEKTLLVVRDLVMGGQTPNWVKLAADLDYYDQAHFCREIKRMTGHTPEELVSMGKRSDDSLWVFHLWG